MTYKTSIQAKEVRENNFATLTNSIEDVTKLYVASSMLHTPPPFEDRRFSYVWLLMGPKNQIIKQGSNSSASQHGDHTKGVFPAVLHALPHAPDCCGLVVISDLSYFTALLNGSADDRRANDYRKGRGKKPFKDAKALRELDDLLESRQITISGRPPLELDEALLLAELKAEASAIARDIGTKPSDRGL